MSTEHFSALSSISFLHRDIVTNSKEYYLRGSPAHSLGGSKGKPEALNYTTLGVCNRMTMMNKAARLFS